MKAWIARGTVAALATVALVGVALPAQAATSSFVCKPADQTVVHPAFPTVTVYYTFAGFVGSKYKFNVKTVTPTTGATYSTKLCQP